MITIKLEENEVSTLIQTLDGDSARLQREIDHTDNRDFRKYLLDRARTLDSLMEKLKEC